MYSTMLFEISLKGNSRVKTNLLLPELVFVTIFRQPDLEIEIF